MSSWGTSLWTTGLLDTAALRRLQAVAVTTVEDLRFALASTPEPIMKLMGTPDLSTLGDLWPVESDQLNFAAAELAPPVLGAEPPPDVEVPQTVPEDLFAASLDALGPTPDDIGVTGPESLSQVDCIACLRPVRDQGDRLTCVAHAVAAAFECSQTRAGHAPTDLSPQFLYWAAKQHDGRPDRGGTLIRVAAERLVADGICGEADWPYDSALRPGNEGHAPPPANAVTVAGSRRAASVTALTRQSSQEIRDSLDMQVPVAFSIPLYAVWANPSGKVPLPIPGAPSMGGHALCAAGYLTDASAPGGGWIIAKNSWGTARAVASAAGPGYFYIPFGYIDQYGWESFTVA